jgi:hypothetical protein
MCEGFGIIVTKNLDLLWSNPDAFGDCSHSRILHLGGMSDNDNEFLRNFVRIEFPTWWSESYTVDEIESLPGWYEENQDEIKARCFDLLDKVQPLYFDCLNRMIEIRNELNKTIFPFDSEKQKNIYRACQDLDKDRETLDLQCEEELEALRLATPQKRRGLEDYWNKRSEIVLKYEEKRIKALEIYKNKVEIFVSWYLRQSEPARAIYSAKKKVIQSEFSEKLSQIKGYLKDEQSLQ